MFHLRSRTFDLAIDGALERRRNLAAIAIPLLGGLALCRPGVDGGDFLLESGVDEAVALERVEASKLGRDDEGCECLSAAAF